MIIERYFCQIFIETYVVGCSLELPWLGDSNEHSLHRFKFYEEISKIIIH